MRGITLGVFSAQPTYDVDFQANVLDVAQTMGYAIPPLERRLLLNRLMKEMKNIGFFQLQDTLANFALGISGYEQFRMIDWKLTGNVYIPVNNPIFTTQGVEGDGVAAYVVTNFNTATMGINYTLDNASRGGVVYKNKTYLNANDSLINSVFGLATVDTLYNWKEGNQKINNSSFSGALLDAGGSGLKILNRTSSQTINLVSKEIYSERTVQSVLLTNAPVTLFWRSSTVCSSANLSIHCLGAAVTYEMSQSFRTIYNQFLSDSGLSPIA